MDQEHKDRRSIGFLAATFSVAGASALNLLVVGVVAIFFARRLGPAAWGIVAVATTVADTAVALGHLSAASTQNALWKKGFDPSEMAATGLVLGLALGVISGAVAWLVATSLLKAFLGGESGWILPLAVLPIPFMIAAISAVESAKNEGRIKGLAISRSVAVIVLALAAAVLLVGNQLSIVTTLIAVAIPSLMTVVVLKVMLHIKIRSASWTLAKKNTIMGLRYHLSGVFVYLVLRLDILILVALVSKADIGRYAVAVALVEASTILADAIASVVRPQQVGGDILESGRVTIWLVKINSVVTLVCAIVIAATATVAIPFVYRQSFSSAVPALWALVPGVVALGAIRGVTPHTVRLPHNRLRIAASFLALTLNVGLIFLLVPRVGIAGAGLASSAAYLLLAGAYVFLVCRSSGIPLRRVIPDRSDITEAKVRFSDAATRFFKRKPTNASG